MSLDLSTLNLKDKFTFGKYAVADETPWPIVWTVVHKAETYLACMPVNILDLREFDAAEPLSADTNQRSYGNNNFAVSNIFKWLNSDAAPGAWYGEAPHSADAVNTSFANRPGFLYHFTDAEKGILQEMTLTLAKNTVTDGGGSQEVTGKVWLPTVTQMGLGTNNGITEGDVFSGFAADADRICYPHPNLIKNTISTSKPSAVSSAWWYWCSSAYTSNSYYARGVSTSGALNRYDAYSGLGGVRPAIYLPVSGVLAESTEFGIQPSTVIEGKSRIYDLSKPDVTFRTVLSGNLEGATIQLFACNNAYDASPKWEDVTDAYLNNSPYSFNNATKTASSWGMQLRAVVTKTNAPAVCLKGCAFEIL